MWPTHQPFGDREQSGTVRGRDIQPTWQISTTAIFKLFDGLRGQKLKKKKHPQLPLKFWHVKLLVLLNEWTKNRNITETQSKRKLQLGTTYLLSVRMDT